MPPDPWRIDVHHHILPAEHVAARAGAGVTESGGTPFPRWSADSTLEAMAKAGIAAAVLSVSSPGVFFGDPAFARRLARGCNERLAGLVRDHPGRFGMLAVLPLPDAAGGVDELAYALDALRADGSSCWPAPGTGSWATRGSTTGRLAMADQLPPVKEKAPRGVVTSLKRLRYDAALSTPPHVVKAVLEFAGPGRVLFGTDYPYAPAGQAAAQADAVRAADYPAGPTREAVLRGNAEGLFPRLRGAGAQAAEFPVPPGPGGTGVAAGVWAAGRRGAGDRREGRVWRASSSRATR